MSRKLTSKELFEKNRRKQLKRDYKFKQALLSADVDIIKAALNRKGIPYSSDDCVVMQTAKYLTSNIRDHKPSVVFAALEKYDEFLEKEG